MPHPELITSITPSPRDPARFNIRVNNRPAVTLAGSLVKKLGLAEGLEWTPDLAHRAARAAAFESAYHALARKLDKRPLSRREAADFLAKRNADPDAASLAIEHAQRVGILDESALARAIIESLTRKKPAGEAMIQSKLAARGIDDETIHQLLADRPRVADPADARSLVDDELPRLSHLPSPNIKRRLAGLLARRGFDEDAIADALERVPEDEAPDA